MTYEDPWDEGVNCASRNFIALNAYIRKEEALKKRDGSRQSSQAVKEQQAAIAAATAHSSQRSRIHVN